MFVSTRKWESAAIPRATYPDTYLLFGADTSKGWRVVRHKVTYDQGSREVEAGRWRTVRDPVTCDLIGFQMIALVTAANDGDIRSAGSISCSIKPKEMQAFAGLRGESRTARMTEDERATMRQPEDFIERTRAKVMVWPYVGPKRGDIVRVWPRSK